MPTTRKMTLDSQARLAAIVESTEDAIIAKSLDGTITEWNAGARKLYGYEAEEMVGKSVMILVPPEDRANAAALMEKVRNGEIVSSHETTRVRKDGRRLRVALTMSPIRAGAGAIVGLSTITHDHTLRILAEEAARRSEAMLSFALQANGIGAWELNLTDHTSIRTPLHDRIFGYQSPLTEWKFEMFLEHILPEDRPEVQSKFNAALSAGTDWRFECRIRRADGEVRWISAAGANPGGSARMVGIVQDITDRKRTELERDQFLKFFQTSSDLMAIADPNGAFKRVNPACTELLGYSEAEIVAKPFVDFIVPEDKQATLDEMARQQKIGSSLNFENRYMCKDGSFKWLSWRAVFNKVEGVTYATARDITERKRAERELQESKSLLEAVVENAPLLVFLKDATDRRFVLINRVGEELLGYDRKSLLGKNVHDLFPGEQAEFFDAKDREILAMGAGVLDIPEEPVLTAKRGQRLIHTRKVAIRGADGVAKYLLGISEDITDRKRIEEALRLSEESYRQLISAMGEGVTLQDADAKLLMSNASAERMLGLTADQLCGRTSFDPGWRSIHEDGSPFPGETHPVPVALKTGLPQTDVVMGIHKPDGTLTWISINVRPIIDTAEKKPDRVVATMRDITERKQAEEKLRKTARALRTLSLCNEAVVRARDEEDLLAKTCEAVVHGGGFLMAWVGYRRDDARKTVQPVAHAGRVDGYLDGIDVTWGDGDSGRGPSGASVRTKAVTICRDIRTDPGMAPWREKALQRGFFSSIALPLVDRDEVLGALTIYSHQPEAFGDEEVGLLKELADDLAYGITSIRARAEVLQAQEVTQRLSAYNRNLIEVSLDPLVTIGADGKVTDVNRATEIATGRARKELIGSDFSSYFTNPERARAGYRKVFEEGQVRDYDLEILGRDGRVTPVLYNAAVYSDEKGVPMGVFAAARDVTERDRAEKVIRRLNADLEQRVRTRTAQVEAANKELEAFTYSVSHDLRAPLRAMDGFSQILMEDYAPKLEPECQRYLGLVRRSAETMARLIDDLLAFSRLGRQEIAKSAVSMEEVVRAAVESLEPQGRGRKVSFKIGALAPCEGDSSLLKQVWINLLSNALKFTRTRPEAVIEIDSHDEAGETVYRVKDNGAGFDMRYVDKLFKVFQRLHPMEKYEGTGVGLAIVARIVARHGGRVWARGEPDHGAEFSFTLGEGARSLASAGTGP
ncbi:MAG: PAS domain S-box protein [Elusimicrobiota bacterium]